MRTATITWSMILTGLAIALGMRVNDALERLGGMFP